jgi:hypothetical protein
MKKIIAFTLILIVVFSSVVCGSSLYKRYKKLVNKEKIGAIREYWTEDLTEETLINRGDSIIVEKIIGVCVNENKDGNRPEKIQVSLSANEAAGVVIPSESATQVLTKDAYLSGVQWTSLPMYDATGRKVAYQVTEARGDEEDSFDSYSNYYEVNGKEENSGKTATIDLTTSENGTRQPFSDLTVLSICRGVVGS